MNFSMGACCNPLDFIHSYGDFGIKRIFIYSDHNYEISHPSFLLFQENIKYMQILLIIKSSHPVLAAVVGNLVNRRRP